MNSKGFTLIELLVVVALMGILVAIAMPMFSEYRERAFDSKVLNMARSFVQAEEAYNTDNETYLDCTINNGASSCGALPGLENISYNGFSSAMKGLTSGLLVGVCHVKAPHGYAFVSDPSHMFYTSNTFHSINIGGVGSCSGNTFSGV